MQAAAGLPINDEGAAAGCPRHCLLLTFFWDLTQHRQVLDMDSASPSDIAAHDVAAETAPLRGENRTRLSGAWTAVVIGMVTLVVILVFILQNQKSVDVSFLIFEGRLPLAVALMFAMILGAFIVFAFGAARLLQLRMVAGRARRQSRQKAT